MNTENCPNTAETRATAVNLVLAFPPLPVLDNGRVRLGGQAPLFQPASIDNGQVHLGGQAPLFLPTIIADAGLVRLGGQSPAF